MNNIKKQLIHYFLLFVIFPCLSNAETVDIQSSECDKLSAPNTIVVVYEGTWLYKHFLFFFAPLYSDLKTYQEVSNEPKYKNWTFYQYTPSLSLKMALGDGSIQFCNADLDLYSSFAVFTKNMSVRLSSISSKQDLEKFLDQNTDITS